MNEIKIIQCLLSILYTINEYENVNNEINVLNKLLKKILKNKKLNKFELNFIIYLSYKYSYLLQRLLNNNNLNRLGKIATMNDLCYNYYKTESFILSLQNKDTEHAIKQIRLINKDILEFNNNYNDKNYVKKIEKKYKNYIKNFLEIIKNWLDINYSYQVIE